MAKVWFNLNRDGVWQLLHSKEVKQICKEIGQKAIDQLGDGYELKGQFTARRYKVKVIAATPQAQQENLEKNTILKAVKGAKL